MEEEIEKLILKSRCSQLQELIKHTNLPRGGYKRDIQLRLLAYIKQDPSPSFFEFARRILAPTTTTSSKQSSKQKISDKQETPYFIDSHNPGPLIKLPSANSVFCLPVTMNGFKFIRSPFFNQMYVLLSPQLLLPEGNTGFATTRKTYSRLYLLQFTSEQSETITYHCKRSKDSRLEFGVQVVLRFTRLDPSACQDLVSAYALSSSKKKATASSDKHSLTPCQDVLPFHLNVQVNGLPVKLPPLLPTNQPGMDGRRHARPINITPILRVSPLIPNHIQISWAHTYDAFTYDLMAAFLMQKRSPQQLTDQLSANSVRSLDDVLAELADKLKPSSSLNPRNSVDIYDDDDGNADDDDDLVMPDILPITLLCPLSKCRIQVPVRSLACQHLQCFDSTTYLLMNERKPAWRCPVCDQRAHFDNLFVDGLFTKLLRNDLTSDLDEIIIYADGSWSAQLDDGIRHPLVETDRSPVAPSKRYSLRRAATAASVDSTSASSRCKKARVDRHQPVSSNKQPIPTPAQPSDNQTPGATSADAGPDEETIDLTSDVDDEVGAPTTTTNNNCHAKLIQSLKATAAPTLHTDRSVAAKRPDKAVATESTPSIAHSSSLVTNAVMVPSPAATQPPPCSIPPRLAVNNLIVNRPVVPVSSSSTIHNSRQTFPVKPTPLMTVDTRRPRPEPIYHCSTFTRHHRPFLQVAPFTSASFTAKHMRPDTFLPPSQWNNRHRQLFFDPPMQSYPPQASRTVWVPPVDCSPPLGPSSDRPPRFQPNAPPSSYRFIRYSRPTNIILSPQSTHPECQKSSSSHLDDCDQMPWPATAAGDVTQLTGHRRSATLVSSRVHQDQVDESSDGDDETFDDNDEVGDSFVIPQDGDDLDFELVQPDLNPELFVPLSPDSGWAWVVLFASVCSSLTIDGIYMSITLLLSEMISQLNASKVQVSQLAALLMGCYQMVGPLSAALINKFGCRWVAIVGSLIASISFFVSSFTNNVTMLTIVIGLIAGLAFGLVHLPAIISVNFYFTRRRGLANSIAVCGTPLGAMVFAPLISFLLKSFHLSNTLLILSAVLLHGIPMACLYRPLRPDRTLVIDQIGEDELEQDACGGGDLHDSLRNSLLSRSLLTRELGRSEMGVVESTSILGQPLYEIDEMATDQQRRRQSHDLYQPCQSNRLSELDKLRHRISRSVVSKPNSMINSIVSTASHSGRGSFILAGTSRSRSTSPVTSLSRFNNPRRFTDQDGTDRIEKDSSSTRSSSMQSIHSAPGVLSQQINLRRRSNSLSASPPSTTQSSTSTSSTSSSTSSSSSRAPSSTRRSERTRPFKRHHSLEGFELDRRRRRRHHHLHRRLRRRRRHDSRRRSIGGGVGGVADRRGERRQEREAKARLQPPKGSDAGLLRKHLKQLYRKRLRRPCSNVSFLSESVRSSLNSRRISRMRPSASILHHRQPNHPPPILHDSNQLNDSHLRTTRVLLVQRKVVEGCHRPGRAVLPSRPDMIVSTPCLMQSNHQGRSSNRRRRRDRNRPEQPVVFDSQHYFRHNQSTTTTTTTRFATIDENQPLHSHAHISSTHQHQTNNRQILPLGYCSSTQTIAASRLSAPLSNRRPRSHLEKQQQRSGPRSVWSFRVTDPTGSIANKTSIGGDDSFGPNRPATVVALLPHRSICVDDYRRPMYRSDIFYDGNLDPLTLHCLTKSKTSSISHLPLRPRSSVSIDQQHQYEAEKRKPLLSGSFHESMINDNDNTKLAESACLMSLTRIPLPRSDHQHQQQPRSSTLSSAVGAPDRLSRLSDQVKRTLAPVYKCCCDRGRDRSKLKSSDGVVTKPGGDYNITSLESRLSSTLSSPRHRSCMRFKRPKTKAFLDTLKQMTDISLFKNAAFDVAWLSNFCAVFGAVIPLIFAAELNSDLGLPASSTPILILINGLAALFGRFVVALMVNFSLINPIIILVICQVAMGLVICSMPYLPSFIGQASCFALCGLFGAGLNCLSSTILVDLVGLDSLTSAVGLVTLSRGLSISVGPPLVGVLDDRLGSFNAAYCLAGVVTVLSGILFIVMRSCPSSPTAPSSTSTTNDTAAITKSEIRDNRSDSGN